MIHHDRSGSKSETHGERQLSLQKQTWPRHMNTICDFLYTQPTGGILKVLENRVSMENRPQIWMGQRPRSGEKISSYLLFKAPFELWC